MRYIIGMDIGGTHTDGVVIDAQETIIARAKCVTTEHLQDGVREVLRILRQSVAPSDISSIFLGTTHGTNALLQCQGLQRVGLLRLAGQNPMLPPTLSWPQALRSAVQVVFETVNGGYECDGRPLTPLSRTEVSAAAERLLEQGAESIAIIGVFSPLSTDQEREVAELLQRSFGKQLPLSLSHEIGSVGFMERENATLLNAALRKTMAEGFTHMEAICQQEGFSAPLCVTQNDGSLLSLSEAIQYPVLTLAAGPTNSFVGAGRLAGTQDAVVIDVGGTSTDVGVLRNGLPLRSMQPSSIGGVSMQFSAPDVLSIALGGGTCICPITHQMGPRSVGRKLREKALCFGGSEMTLTDVAIRLGHIAMPGTSAKRLSLHPNMPSYEECCALYRQAEEKITQLVRQMRGRHQELPCLFVGGGSALFSTTLMDDFDVANAYGAALAEVAGTVDTIVSLADRERTLHALGEQAQQQAIAKGANPHRLRLTDQQIIPYPYASGQMARVILRWSGKP